MTIKVSEFPGINVREIKSAVKSQGVVFGDMSVSREAILDIVAKIQIGDSLIKEQKKYRLLVENLVVYRGLSMRRMGESPMRNKFKVQGKGKVSVKNREDDTRGEIARELAELSLEVSSTAILGPVYRIGNALYRRIFQAEKPESQTFSADLVLKEEGGTLGTLKSTSHRWNSFPSNHDTAFEIDHDTIVGNPVIYNISEINISSLNGSHLHTRMNVPISGLNSDTASGLEIITETIISILDNTGKKQVISTSFGQVNGEYTYETIADLVPYDNC